MDAEFWQALITESIASGAVVLAALITVGIPAWRKLHRVDRQVTNSHDTNLRDDVDRAIATSSRAVDLSESNREWIGNLATEVRRLADAHDRRPRWWPSRRGSGNRP